VQTCFEIATCTSVSAKRDMASRPPLRLVFGCAVCGLQFSDSTREAAHEHARITGHAKTIGLQQYQDVDLPDAYASSLAVDQLNLLPFALGQGTVFESNVLQLSANLILAGGANDGCTDAITDGNG
jgi:hypothetical protein